MIGMEKSLREIENHRIKELIEEAVSGITKMDILPNKAQPLQREGEKAYFKEMRDFMENSIAVRTAAVANDVFEGK